MDPRIFYNKPEVKRIIAKEAEDREAWVRFGEKGPGKRPDVISYENDVVELARQGATSFHYSVERWHNPLQLQPNMSKVQLAQLRKGWDLVIDIDSKFEYSQIAADLIVKAILHYKVHSVSCKFSGNKGFHIAIPFEAYPAKVNGLDTADLFPDGPRMVAAHIQELIRPHLIKKMMSWGMEKVAKDFGKQVPDLLTDGKLDPYKVIEIDTLVLTTRHMIRMPYSLHEKSGLVSVPLDPTKIMEFKREDATPEKVPLGLPFIRREDAKPDEARTLFVQAFDTQVALNKKKEELAILRGLKTEKDYQELTEKIPAEHFPPCMKQIMAGLKDGRKRSMFIIVQFLGSVGWGPSELEEFLIEWNNRNAEKLSETLIKGQIDYYRRRQERILPPNCDNKSYYIDFGVCHPDSLCSRIKNPAQYAKRSFLMKKRSDEEQEKEAKKRKKNLENATKNREVPDADYQ